MAHGLSFSFTDGFRNGTEHGRCRAADVIKEFFRSDIFIFCENEWQSDDSLGIHAKASKNDIGSTERCKFWRCSRFILCFLLASRENALFHRVVRIELE